MDTIINKLYYGEICPSEKPAPQTKWCIENRVIICETEAKLIEQFLKFKELLDTYSVIRTYQQYENILKNTYFP